jgi:hypothetical protein
LVALIGAGAAFICSRYRFGSLTSMGPGFFPTVLGVLLVILGVMIAMTASESEAPTAFPTHGHDTPAGFDFRGWACIIAAPLAFIFLAESVGFLVAAFSAVLIAAAGDRTATLKASVLLAAGVTAFAIVLFINILHVEIPIFRGM